MFIPLITTIAIMSSEASSGLEQLTGVISYGLSQLIALMSINMCVSLKLVAVLFFGMIAAFAGLFPFFHRRIFLIHTLRNRFRATALMDEEEFTDTQLEERMDFVEKKLSYIEWEGNILRSQTRISPDSGVKGNYKSTQCPICLNEFRNGEYVAWSSSCIHLFHKECIYAWLLRNTACPMCRIPYLPEMTENEEAIWNSLRE